MLWDHQGSMYLKEFNRLANERGYVKSIGFVSVPPHDDEVKEIERNMNNLFNRVKRAKGSIGYDAKAHHKTLQAFCKAFPNTHTMLFAKIVREINQAHSVDNMILNVADFKTAFLEKTREVFDDQSIEQ